ncbi:ferrochelatase [Paenibacillus sp. MBLB2552]|uniref:Coproporphyrin III ferrochelatase n=1 Tax=Paenibacillus mellifer TaxID=2937794 RepID=A0A9X2BQ99_9BACL|nr:ferrochelatase [Paenibacillus mellifer]MCK8488118.1 ferrochelatase [Paenibacillus mellifer]
MSQSSHVIGVLLAQVGTPSEPTAKEVRPFLRRFLSDRRVIDYPPLLWQPLLRGVILAVRPKRSARLYARIWGEEGSPLLAISRRQQAGLQQRLGDRYKVELGFAYSEPDIAQAMSRLEAAGADRILVLPMYPQYSSTTTAAIYDAACFAALGKARRSGPSAKRFVPELRLAGTFFDHPGYIRAMQVHLTSLLQGLSQPPDRFLLSFHGIPQRYADGGDPYPEQCRETARLLAEAMGWTPEQWDLAYQSRFGPETWLGPSTAEQLQRLADSGAKRPLLFAPGFVADCLETLYELGVEAKEDFTARSGGASDGDGFTVAPCLNDQPDWLEALAGIVRDQTKGWADA